MGVVNRGVIGVLMYVYYTTITPPLCIVSCAAKVPFPLTLRFKTMLQRGIELQSLSSSWLAHTYTHIYSNTLTHIHVSGNSWNFNGCVCNGICLCVCVCSRAG